MNKITFFVVCLFGIGSWVAMNGLWVELPILIDETPEKWTLASYLTVICQMGNIGIIVYLCLARCFNKQKLQHYTILITTIGGGIALIMLSIFWNKTTFIFGVERSLALLILVFAVSIVDCTSSITFLPFMAILPETYLVPFFMGESFSGLIPSLVVLLQGTYRNSSISVNNHNATVVHDNDGLNFSQGTFFVCLALLMFLSPLSYLLIKYSPAIKKIHVCDHVTVLQQDNDEEKMLLSDNDVIASNTVNSQQDSVDKRILLSYNDVGTNSLNSVGLCTKVQLLFLLVLLNVLQNGVVSSISSYAYAPYGIATYHLAASLGNIFAALSCLLYKWLPAKSTKLIYLFSSLYFVSVAIIFAAALKSPNPWLKTTAVGKTLAILISILSSSLVAYSKLSIATAMKKMSNKYLLYCGIAIQLGCFVGAVAMFPIVNYTAAFKAA